jgi:hypothetical protein
LQIEITSLLSIRVYCIVLFGLPAIVVAALLVNHKTSDKPLKEPKGQAWREGHFIAVQDADDPD